MELSEDDKEDQELILTLFRPSPVRILHSIRQEIDDAAVGILPPGGVPVMATLPEEEAEQVAKALADRIRRIIVKHWLQDLNEYI